MTEQTHTKALTVTNYDRIKALAYNEDTIERFAQMLGNRREAQSYIVSAMLTVANSKDLMECTPSSILNAVMRSAALKLSCDPALRQAHLVPYNNSKTGKKEATLIPGYIGINNLALRTEKYRYLNTNYLYEGQTMEINQLTGAARITGERKGDKIVGYFHYFELYAGTTHTLYMTVEELKEHGQRYAPKNPMWRTDFPAMCKKTVTRLNLLKHGILDPKDRAVLNEIEDDRPEGEPPPGRKIIDAQFTDADDDRAAQDAQALAEAAANAPKPDPQETIDTLYGKETSTYAPEPPPVTDPEPDPLPPLRYAPDVLKATLAETSKKMTGQVSNGKRGLVANALESILSQTTNPEASRHQLLVYLTGYPSLKEVPDNVILALFAWLKPAKNPASSIWEADAMATREALAAFNAAQPKQEAML